MSWLAREPKATRESYLQAGTAVVAHLFSRLGLTVEGQTYSREESKAISDFLNDFVAWGRRQAPPLFALNAEGQVFCIPGLPPSSLQGYTTSAALQKLYGSDAHKRKGARETLATALRAWISHTDSQVFRDMIPMLRELGWENEIDRVSELLLHFPPNNSNDKFLRLCKSLLVLEKDPPPSHCPIASTGGGEPIKPGSGQVSRGLQERPGLRPHEDVAPSSDKARILVCDDQEAIVEIISATLVTAGYEVRFTLNSLEAIEIAREFSPNVAVLGLIMPRIDGFKLGVKLAEFLPRTKIVLASEAEAKDLDTIREQGYSFDVLPSPFKKEELLEKMRTWISEAGGGRDKIGV